MALTAQSFEFYAGDLKTLTIALTNDVLSGDPTAFTPSTGYNLIFTAKDSNNATDRAAKFQYSTGVGITHSTTNAVVVVHPIDTRPHGGKTLYFDIQAQSLTSADDIRTVAVGTLVLKRETTRQTTTSVPLHTISAAVPYIGRALVVTHEGGDEVQLTLADHGTIHTDGGAASGEEGVILTLPEITSALAAGFEVFVKATRTWTEADGADNSIAVYYYGGGTGVPFKYGIVSLGSMFSTGPSHLRLYAATIGGTNYWVAEGIGYWTNRD